MKTKVIFPYIDAANGESAGTSISTYRELLLYDTKITIDSQKKIMGTFGLPSQITDAINPIKLGMDLKDVDLAYTVNGYLCASSRQDATDTYAHNSVNWLIKLQESGLPCAVIPMLSDGTVIDNRFSYLSTATTGATIAGATSTTVTITSGKLIPTGVRAGHYARFDTGTTYYRVQSVTSTTVCVLETAAPGCTNKAYYISPCSVLLKTTFNIVPEDIDAPENIECTLQFLRQVNY